MAGKKTKEKEKARIDNEEAQREKMMKASILEQQMNKLQEQSQIVEQQLAELQALSLHMEDLKKLEKGNEVLASIGKNIFLKTNLVEKELLVDIGSKTLVKKSSSETKKIIEKDIEKLEDIRNKIKIEMEKIISQLQALMT